MHIKSYKAKNLAVVWRMDCRGWGAFQEQEAVSTKTPTGASGFIPGTTSPSVCPDRQEAVGTLGRQPGQMTLPQMSKRLWKQGSEKPYKQFLWGDLKESSVYLQVSLWMHLSKRSLSRGKGLYPDRRIWNNVLTSPLFSFHSQFAMPKILALQVLGLEALHNKWKRKNERSTISQIFHQLKAYFPSNSAQMDSLPQTSSRW